MKKIVSLVALLLVSACSAQKMIDEMHSYPIDFYGDEPELVGSEYKEERAQPLNHVLTAYVGYTVVDKKIYRKTTYASEELRANKNGIMSGTGMPIRFKINERKKVFGSVNIEDGRFLIIPADLPDYVILIGSEGKIYKNLGQIKNNRLLLINDDFITRPIDFRFENITTSKSEQTKPEKGFDIKYGGIKLDRMVFTYMDYSKLDGERGYFEDINFPLTQENIEIGGVGFKVLKATKDKLDYVILK